ncbi:DUF6424 family protein [Streptomyces griseoluteus]|uniref:DUF6424 family protein n=1 Tax=Streptomyces griseoluteus TaxID=29306 RepID=UPI00199706C1|nr:DUF6424 family protein [Streptomyces griseoluteus]GHF33912.1 hypothetical protein GCM10017776_60570 [Streptomyces griseoluteus]
MPRNRTADTERARLPSRRRTGLHTVSVPCAQGLCSRSPSSAQVTVGRSAAHPGCRGIQPRPIKDADDVEAWTDFLFNSRVCLSHANHQGILPGVPGEHPYSWLVKGADFVRYDDFPLWVTLPDGTRGAVAPVDRRGFGDGQVRLAFVPEGSAAASTIADAQDRGLVAVLPANSDVWPCRHSPGRATVSPVEGAVGPVEGERAGGPSRAGPACCQAVPAWQRTVADDTAPGDLP